MSTIFRERERERDWETSSHGGRSYTTVKRYKIPDHALEEDTYESEMRLVHRPRHSDIQERREVREYVIDRDDSPRDREVREYRFVEREVERDPSPRREIREYRIEREVERSPSPPAVREYRVERQVERDSLREDPYQLERYSRSTEFFRPEQPSVQPIIIRNEAPQPIILQESAPQQVIIRREEPAYELVERSEVIDDRQIARREPRREEDYYYERKVKEVDRGGRREEDYYDEREYGRGRYHDRDAYSDDEIVFYHKEKDTYGGRDVSPHHRRHLAEGVIGGVAAAELLRHHRKRQGEDPGHHVRKAVGYGALGAVSAEAISRYRHRSRSRSSSHGRGRRRRSRSSSRTKKLGTLAAVAGIGALAYAAGRKNNNNTTVIEDRRSRSRRRKASRSRSKSVVREGSRGRSSSRHKSPEHRNRRAAQVGLASAAVAGIVEHKRHKSRDRKGERSRSRIRQGVPIAAAGVAGAAVTGLYERHKAKKEAKESSRSRSKSRSKSRSRSVRSGRRRSTGSDTALVEYGGDPIYADPVSSRRSRDIDPAEYRHRRRSVSSSSDDGRRRRSRSSRSRSKSRTRKVAETAAVAGVAGLAAHEAARRRDRKKAEKERQRKYFTTPSDGSLCLYYTGQEDSAYSTGSYSPPPPGADTTDPRYFPETNYFPPPPSNPVDHNSYPPYNPADYPPPNSAMPPPNGYIPSPGPPETGNPYARQEPMYRRPDDNVSAQPLPEHMQARGGSRFIPAHAQVSSANATSLPDRLKNQSHTNGHGDTDGNVSPLPRTPIQPDPVYPSSAKSVQFDLNPQEFEIPSNKERSSDRQRDHGEDKWQDTERSRKSGREKERDARRSHRDESPGSDDSGDTIELPPRFDEHGRKREDDPLADKLESVLTGLFR